jgi:hypothetical protein
MKKLLFIILLLAVGITSGQTVLREKTLTAVDSIMIVISQHEWVEITVIDTGSVADTVFVHYPVTVGSTTTYARVGKIMDLSTGENVTAMVSSATALTKTYILWVPHPRAIRLMLGDTSTGSVFVRAVGKP